MANKNLFNSIQVQRPNRNTFDLTHDVKTTFDMGRLVPIMAMECVPGDNVKIGNETLVRFMPMVNPVMHRFDLFCHYFFVPNRILWPGWEEWIADGSGAAHPYVDINAANWSLLADYFQIPDPASSSVPDEEERINPFCFAAYQMIYHEYYRDQNLVPANEFLLQNGDNTAEFEAADGLNTIRNRAWQHDYFTSALPFMQKGDPVSIPLGAIELNPTTGISPLVKLASTHANMGISDLGSDAGSNLLAIGGNAAVLDPNGTLQVGDTTINDLRRAFRLQEFLERNARAGTRYSESIYGHFGVRSDDARLNRPEYITGVKTPVVISEVLSTVTVDDAPQGNMSGRGIAIQQGRYGSYFCKEHGYIIGIMSLMPKTAYQQGLPKHFLKFTDRFQYYWPEFANIGEQEVLNKEVYAFQGASGAEVFGYTPRYAEYKYMNNAVSGEFRDTMNTWHAGRIFDGPPQLNQDFITSDPTTRIFAADSPASLVAHVLNKVYASRLMPKFGTPSF